MVSIVKYAPHFSEAEAVKIANDLYGLSVSAAGLPSERDQNFHLTAANGEQYVLKLANSTESIEVLEFQNEAMMHITRARKKAEHNAPVCPQVISNRQAESITIVRGPDGAEHFVRLLTYLPGKPFALVKPHDSELLLSLGCFFGELDLALRDFEHPAAHRDFQWDLKNAARVVHEYLHLIQEPQNRALVKEFVDRFQSDSEPQFAGLRRAVVHNDGNDYNVLVVPHDRWQHRVGGVIDFGDMVYTYTVSEVAIACAYAMLDKADPLAVACRVVAGYHQVFALTETELAVLFDLICMRLCMSVCHCVQQFRSQPANEYLLISNKPAWKLLYQLAGIHPRFACYVFRHACGLPPVPHSAKISDWLQHHFDRFGPVVPADVRGANQLVFDLSVGSDLVPAGGDAPDASVFSRRLFEHMQAAGATVGIGRYDEARAIYTAEHFKMPSDQMPEQRTIHLGIDLHMSSGTPVYAFLDGTVHSFANNSQPFDYGPTIILKHRTEAGDVFYTLYGHLSLDSLSGLQVEMPLQKGAAFARLGDAEVNGGWPPHLHFQIITDMLDQSGNFPGVAPPSQREVWKSISPDPNLVLGIPATSLRVPGRSHAEILDIRHRHFGKNLSIAYKKPLKIVRGKGAYLYCQDGQAYLDGVNNVCHVGHCHPQVVAAGQCQMAVLNTNTRYLHDHIIDYAHRLFAKFSEPLRVCFFVCSGSEANELALRLARTYTGQQDIITVEGAYHGNTQALIDISPYKHDGPGGRGRPPWVHKVTMPDGYRGAHKGTAAATGARYAQYVRETIDNILSANKGLAAFICESMLGCGGQIVLPENYLRQAFKAVRAAGGLCIVDEVQVGFGRVGSHFWAFETQGVVPDIVTLGKPMGNGHPLAAVITTPEIADAFANGMEYFNTFGGNPVSCAIGLAVLDVIENEGLQENARRVGALLLDGLKALQEKYALIGDVRGLGLYVGIELVTDRATLEPATAHADYIINRMRDHGILISTDGPMENVLKMKPPMVWTEQNAQRVVDTLDKILGADCLQV
jgi:4-aminobutyrate aminotransferase-like enzyme/Ser/Thr protein kinase RdoA (MazF antagonist)